MNIPYTTSSTKHVPQFPNHRIIEYETYHWSDASGELHTAFEPVYERITALCEVYWHIGKQVFLVNDLGKAYDIKGNVISVDVTKLRASSSDQQKVFYDELEKNGYKIVKGELEQTTYFFPLYTLDYGFIVCTCQYEDNNYKRFKAWNEVFETRNECINWCDHLNDTMQRDYPKVQ